MNDDDRRVLAAVAMLNHDMGAIVVALINTARPDGSLSPVKLRELAAICDDMSSLLDNHADRLDRASAIVVEGRISLADHEPVPLLHETTDEDRCLRDRDGR